MSKVDQNWTVVRQQLVTNPVARMKMKNLMLVLVVLLIGSVPSVHAILNIEYIYDFDAPDTGPITGLGLRNGNLYAVSAGTNTLYRMNDDTGVIQDAWPVPVPDGYTITGLGCDEGNFSTYIGLTSPDSCEKIIRHYYGDFTSYDVPEVDYLRGLSCTWYTAGRGYIGTYNQMWSFEKTNPPVTDVTFEFNYPSPGSSDLPRDIACENPENPTGNIWIANFCGNPYTNRDLTLVNSSGEWIENFTWYIGDIYGITCRESEGITHDYDIFVSTGDGKITMYSYSYWSALEQNTWGAIKSSF